MLISRMAAAATSVFPDQCACTIARLVAGEGDLGERLRRDRQLRHHRQRHRKRVQINRTLAARRRATRRCSHSLLICGNDIQCSEMSRG